MGSFLLSIRAPAVLAALVLLLSAVGCGPAESVAPRRAPELRLPDLENRSVALADFQGSVVLLEFWSTLCDTCRSELPMLNTLQERLQPKGFTVLSVCTNDVPAAALKSFARANGLKYPVLMARGADLPGYGLYGLPQAFLVGRGGFIRRQYMGPKELDEVLRDAEAALAASP